MNNQKAKLLRKIARKMTERRPEVEYYRDVHTASKVVDPKSTKGVYKRLKKDRQFRGDVLYKIFGERDRSKE